MSVIEPHQVYRALSITGAHVQLGVKRRRLYTIYINNGTALHSVKMLPGNYFRNGGLWHPYCGNLKNIEWDEPATLRYDLAPN